MPHLLRGIFDGDGTITIDKNGQAHIAFFGSQKICQQISKYLHNTIGLNNNKVSKTTCYHVWYGGNNVTKTIMKFMYDNCDKFYLDRKYNRFKQVV